MEEGIRPHLLQWVSMIGIYREIDFKPLCQLESWKPVHAAYLTVSSLKIGSINNVNSTQAVWSVIWHVFIAITLSDSYCYITIL